MIFSLNKRGAMDAGMVTLVVALLSAVGTGAEGAPNVPRKAWPGPRATPLAKPARDLIPFCVRVTQDAWGLRVRHRHWLRLKRICVLAQVMLPE